MKIKLKLGKITEKQLPHNGLGLDIVLGIVLVGPNHSPVMAKYMEESGHHWSISCGIAYKIT
jgi:hypothetical protein